MKCQSKIKVFYSRKCVWKYSLPKWRPFCSGGDELTHRGTEKMAAIFHTTFVNAYVNPKTNLHQQCLFLQGSLISPRSYLLQSWRICILFSQWSCCNPVISHGNVYKYTYSCRSMKTSKPRWVIIYSKKKQNKDNKHEMQKMIILLKWADFRYYFLLCSTRRGE